MKDERIEQAILILDEYQKQHKIEKQRKLAISAVEYTGMPSGSSKGNPSENKMVKGISATQFCDIVRAVIKSLDQDIYIRIIEYKYIKNIGSCEDVADYLNLPRTTFFRKKDQALLNFYELCPAICEKAI